MAHARIGRVSRYPDLDLTPPVAVQREAARGLELRRAYGRGGTAVGVARAVQLKNGRTVAPQTLRRMHNYFTRHRKDLDAPAAQPGHPGYPSAGVIAWLLWGGDAGDRWAERLVAKMRAADE